MTTGQFALTLAVVVGCSAGVGNSWVYADDIGSAAEDALRSVTDTSDIVSTEPAGKNKPCANITPDSSKKEKAACNKYLKTHPQQ